VKPLELSEALFAIELLPRFLPSDEPIGPITDKGLRALDGAVQQAFATFDGRHLYWFLYHRAALLFYVLAKDHAIGNGNKRCAVIVTMVFLVKNNKAFSFTASELYDIALMVAKSEASDMQKIVEILKKSFKENITDLPE
jgi:death-on-curing protein